MTRPNKKIESDVIELKLTQADEKIASAMKCNTNTPVYFLKRLHIVYDTPFTIKYLTKM